MKAFKTWNEYINFPGPLEEKLQILANSNLGTVSPGAQRSV